MLTAEPTDPADAFAALYSPKARTAAVTPRESMQILPAPLQPFLTWLTGMPIAGQAPLLRWTPWRLIVCTASEIICGLLVGAASLHHTSWATVLLLPVSWLLVTGGLRTFFVVIEHCCTHHIFSRTRNVNVAVAEWISVLFWTQDYDGFKREHATHHKITRMADDPDAKFLRDWGFAPGMPRDQVRRQLFRTLLSPTYHVSEFISRMRYSMAGSRLKACASISWCASLLFAMSTLHIWYYGVLLWLIPITVLFQASMLINILTEHRWPARVDDRRHDLGTVCFGRFCGERIPATAGRSFAARGLLWTRWWVRLMLVYLPYRVFILVGDEGQHDFHHRQPMSDWVNAKFARYAHVTLRSPDRYGAYTDVWGSLFDHLDASCTPHRSGTAETITSA